MPSAFDARKAVGTAAEVALRHLLTRAGALVIEHQRNRDLTHHRPGAAVAHGGSGAAHHLPDLMVYWPSRVALPRHGCEVKAKSPLRAGGGWGWDRRAFERAWRWSRLSGDPVLYAVRDLSAAPLSQAGEADEPDHWWVASVWKLHNSPQRGADPQHFYWPREEFLPLALLLDGRDFATATVPFIALRDAPPMLL